MWMSARNSWQRVAWFVIDVVQIGLYVVKVRMPTAYFVRRALWRVSAHGRIRLAAVATEDG